MLPHTDETFKKILKYKIYDLLNWGVENSCSVRIYRALLKDLLTTESIIQIRDFHEIIVCILGRFCSFKILVFNVSTADVIDVSVQIQMLEHWMLIKLGKSMSKIQ